MKKLICAIGLSLALIGSASAGGWGSGSGGTDKAYDTVGGGWKGYIAKKDRQFLWHKKQELRWAQKNGYITTGEFKHIMRYLREHRRAVLQWLR